MCYLASVANDVCWPKVLIDKEFGVVVCCCSPMHQENAAAWAGTKSATDAGNTQSADTATSLLSRFDDALLSPPLSRSRRRHPTAAMVLEATILCIDNSEYVRNSDYLPTRLQVRHPSAARYPSRVFNVIGARCSQQRGLFPLGAVSFPAAATRVSVRSPSDAVPFPMSRARLDRRLRRTPSTCSRGRRRSPTPKTAWACSAWPERCPGCSSPPPTTWAWC